MTLAIGVASQKGGVGKTTIARALAAAFALNGWSVKIIDLDIKQGTATSWQQRRLRAGISPEVPVQMYANVATALRRAAEADVLIFDGAPHATQETVAIAKASDLLIIPTGLSLDDLEPSVMLANTLADEEGIPIEKIVFAFSNTSSSAAELEAARDYLSKTRFGQLDGSIQKKTAYSLAMDSGLSIIETPYKSPRAQAQKLIQSAIQTFERLTEQAS